MVSDVAPAKPSSTMPKSSITIAVIGDVHDQWESEDSRALTHLGVDLALFVGDFGNESIDIVQAIADYDAPKAVIFGNHDAWYNATSWGRAKCPYNLRTENRVQKQLDLLGETHVGYRALDFPQFGLTVVGARPFSWGGPDWRNKRFYRQWYDVESFEQSIEKMKTAVDDAAYDTLIFIGHTGPTGLGDCPEDICGRDWNPLGGDFGDPDLAAAIAYARSNGKSVPLVTFGHMHHTLRHTKKRLREQIVVDEAKTVNLNAARVPRIIENHGTKLRNFSFVTLTDGSVSNVSLAWVNEDNHIEVEDELYDAQTRVEPLSSMSL